MATCNSRAIENVNLLNTLQNRRGLRRTSAHVSIVACQDNGALLTSTSLSTAAAVDLLAVLMLTASPMVVHRYAEPSRKTFKAQGVMSPDSPLHKWIAAGLAARRSGHLGWTCTQDRIPQAEGSPWAAPSLQEVHSSVSYAPVC